MPRVNVELIAIGNELLLGHVQDTNSTVLSAALAAAGLPVARRTTVSDDPESIGIALSDALARADIVITTGGLGPTADDITKKVVADFFGLSLEMDDVYLADLERRFAKLGLSPMPQSNRSQALVPEGAEVIPNRRGSAPGLWITRNGDHAIMLPGVPHEMKGILEEELIPRLKERFWAAGARVTRTRTLRTAGIGESALADKLVGFEDEIAPLSLAYLPGLAGVDLRITAWHAEEDTVDEKLDSAVTSLQDKLGHHHYYGLDETDMAAVVIDALRHAGSTIAVAESCTGGLVGGRITAIPGSSDVFIGGIVCYSNAVKEGLLCVSHSDLEKFGAVSAEVAGAMARAVAERFGTDTAVAVTGIAGPGGGSEEKPVGTVFMAVLRDGEVTVRKRHFPGHREWVRGRAAQEALNLVRLALV